MLILTDIRQFKRIRRQLSNKCCVNIRTNSLARAKILKVIRGQVRVIKNHYVMIKIKWSQKMMSEYKKRLLWK